MPDPSDAEARTVAWFHCFSGIAGDMALGSLVDAGADLDEVRNLCERLPVGGWSLEAEAVMRTGIGGTKVHVGAEPSTVVRTAAHITGMVEEARLPDRVRQRALATFDVLARAEGHVAGDAREAVEPGDGGARSPAGRHGDALPRDGTVVVGVIVRVVVAVIRHRRPPSDGRRSR